MSYIKFLKDISKKDIKGAGGKGASLGEMTKAGLPVPPGFVVITEACRKFNDKLIPAETKEEILKAFDKLRAGRVAVRSSAVAEDSKTASWAGQLESFLNITRKNLIENIINCWNSIKSKRAISYAVEQKLSKGKLAVAVVVQKMVKSEVSGVCFTVHPVTKIKNQMVIEAVRGLGESLVQGKVTPDNYIIDKNDWVILDINIPDGEKQKLSGKKIIELTKLCAKIEKHYKEPQDIEWALEKNKLYIVQSRPITTLWI